ncbi:MAG: PD40 domain-containing protein [Ignavibacteria bacterium]|nr:PD40 domain-containing protein [Ignavibacteria bacterium]
MNEDGSNVRQLAGDSTFPVYVAQWSPDGNKIALSSSAGVYITNADGTGKYLCAKPGFQNADFSFTEAYGAVWSPDSKHLAYTRMFLPEFFGAWAIFTIDVDGSNERCLTHTPDSSAFVTDWSRDGSSLLGWEFGSAVIDSTQLAYPYDKIVWFDLQGHPFRKWGEIRETIYEPIYSTSGRKIAFISSKPGGANGIYQGVYVMNVDGSGDTLVSRQPHTDNEPVSFSPDDTKLLYNASGPAYGWGGLYGTILILDLHSGEVSDITPFKGDSVYSEAAGWRRR